MKSNPSWWTTEHDSRWDRVKDAFARDWEQTKHDFGSKEAPNLHQSVGDTVQQATASHPAANDFATHEGALRYGHGAQTQHSGQAWDDALEGKLRSDYSGDWESDREHVKRAYHYKAS